jgi:ADP-ribose pyrophosphatase
MEAVRHRGSVVLIPQPTPGQVILVRQFRYVIGCWIWELPAGSLEAGEAPARAARRECEEEIGLRPTSVRRLGSYYPSPGFCDERMHFYVCAGLVRRSRPAPRDADEQLEPRMFSIRHVWRMIAAGQVVDMKTVVGLTLLDGREGLERRRSRRITAAT